MSSYIDENDDNVGYLTIEYNGRMYMSYGVLKGTLMEEDIEKNILDILFKTEIIHLQLI